jgi:hypothetical protein
MLPDIFMEEVCTYIHTVHTVYNALVWLHTQVFLKLTKLWISFINILWSWISFNLHIKNRSVYGPGPGKCKRVKADHWHLHIIPYILSLIEVWKTSKINLLFKHFYLNMEQDFTVISLQYSYFNNFLLNFYFFLQRKTNTRN